MASLRPLGEDNLVSIGGLRLSGRIDNGVREDAVREMLEWLHVFLRIPVCVLVTLRIFAASGQPSITSDVGEARGVIRDGFFHSKYGVRMLAFCSLSLLLVSHQHCFVALLG